jgi:hypothetical protein
MCAVARAWLVSLLVLSVSATVSAQQSPSTSVALAKELAAAMDAAKLDSVGARDPASPDRFFGALYFPGTQLLVVAAKYAAPLAMTEQIAKKNYRDVYLDLSSASVAGTKMFIEDLGANGVIAKPETNQPFDTYEAPDGKRTAFDGEWKQQQLSEEDYLKTFAAVDAAYSAMLRALIAQVKTQS